MNHERSDVDVYDEAIITAVREKHNMSRDRECRTGADLICE
jgi:hypothetical protein